MHMDTRRGWAVLIVGVLVLAGCGKPSGDRSREAASPIQVRDASDARPAVAGARVVTRMVFDDDALRVDPPPVGKPKVDEAKAIAYLRAASLPGSYVDVSSVVVAYGEVTLKWPVDVTDVDVRPRRVPTFRARPAWLLLHESGAHGCPAMPPSASSPPRSGPTREPLRLELIAADGSGEAVAYSTAGRFCGTSVAVHVAPATYTVSVPWTQVGPQNGRSATIAATPPPCGTISGYVGPGPPDRTVAVAATVLMARPPCQGDGQPGRYDATNDGAPLRHAPTGLVTGMYTDGQGKQFRYYDGSDQVLP